MIISGTNREIIEILNLLDPLFKCKCNPNINRFRIGSHHDCDCLFEEELPQEYGIHVRSYNVEYDGHKIIKAIHIDTFYSDGNILNGTVR